MKNNTIAWRTGAYYFAGLAFICILLSLFSGILGAFDVVMFCLGLLPLLIRNRFLLIAYGLLGILLHLYLGMACIHWQLGSTSSSTIMEYAMGYALAVFGLAASTCLFYSAIQHETNSFRLV